MRKISSAKERKLMTAGRTVQINERAGLEITHGLAVELDPPTGIDDPGKGLVAQDKDSRVPCFRRPNILGQRVERGTSPGRRSAACYHGDSEEHQWHSPRPHNGIECPRAKRRGRMAAAPGSTHFMTVPPLQS